MPVDQDDVPSALLQMQRRADADHACTQDENIGLQFRHPVLPSNAPHLRPLFNPKLVIAAATRKPA
ncbi:MAG: hypothetical protein NVSMB20_12650 [Bradyrhizobium sp.]